MKIILFALGTSAFGGMCIGLLMNRLCNEIGSKPINALLPTVILASVFGFLNTRWILNRYF